MFIVKKLYLALLILIPCLLQAQRERIKPQQDSLAIYQRELDSLYRQALDSLRTSEAYMRALGKVDKFSRKIKGYSGFTIFLDALHSDYGQFNEMLAQEGFPPLEETV